MRLRERLRPRLRFACAAGRAGLGARVRSRRSSRLRSWLLARRFLGEDLAATDAIGKFESVGNRGRRRVIAAAADRVEIDERRRPGLSCLEPLPATQTEPREKMSVAGDLAPPATRTRLTIRTIETIPIRVPLARTYRGSRYKMTHRSTLITRVVTEDGLVGEAYAG